MDFQVNQIFENEYPPEAALWCNENSAYIEEISQVDGKRRFQIKAVPEPSLEEVKSFKLQELESEFLDYRTSKTTFVNSSLGFKVNANSTAYMDVDGLIGILASQREAGTENPTITFMDFDNVPHDLNEEQLTTIKNEISMNGSRAYEVKWAYRGQINLAESAKELGEITFSFEPSDGDTSKNPKTTDTIGVPTIGI